MRAFTAASLSLALVAAPAMAEERVERRDQGDRTEFDAVPVAGGDSDIGIGGGELSALTRHARGLEPYAWRLESAAFLSFKARDGGGVGVPYQDYYLLWTLPHLVKNALRLEVRPSFTEESTLRYYGLGNASAPTPIPDSRDPYYEYSRTHLTLAVHARLTVARHFYALVGNVYSHNWLEIRPNSRLSDDRRSNDPRLRAILAGDDRSHGVDLFEYALIYDDRDDETSTHRGHYDQVTLRLSPGGTEALPYRYAQANVTLRAYASPIAKRLTFAARVVGDAIFGDPPFYELPRFDDTYAIGGANGVRGVPAQRYSGKVKLFGNLEARSELLPFFLFAKTFVLGAAAFFDGGRVWADTRPSPALDGSGLGLKYGIGGGLRLHQGDSFVVRLDVAWSPDAQPIGAYFAANQIF